MTRAFSTFSLYLLLFCGLAGAPGSAAAQQQEKRIALVVGDGAYAKSPLATAANDAGLIAQTLQAAGFDVVGARDLDGDTLRRSFRDFVQKAQSSGPDTVAMVYLAGYGIQLAGENYFIPVDAPLSRDTDIPIEGLRISDYVRELSSLPLKANIVVLDAARQQSFIEGGQPIASGLALVEPQAHMLIAFNAAPGTVAPEEQGPYGAYAQSLAEMIRTGGLPLPEVFNRLRLRVNETTKGAQVPWDAEKIDAQFMFFDRAPDAPAQAPPDQAVAARNKPLRDLGVQDAYAASLERDTMQGYEDFLGAYPGDPLALRVRAIVAARREAITWLRTYRADTPPAYWSYLRRYPDGPHAWDARRRLAILTAPLEPPPSFAAFDYDVPPPPPDEIAYVDRPVLYFGDPAFGFVPPPPPPIFFLPPPPPDFVVLSPPIAPIGLFILPQPLFVPIPVYVRAPVYVASPPNNIIFNNIHNTTVINNVINQPPQPGPGGAGAALPGATRGAPGTAAATTPTAAGAALPPSVAQRASLIQQGKLPVPPSASINPAVKPATAGAPAGVSAAPAAPQPARLTPEALSKTNALPVPGAKGGPPVVPGATGPTPNATNPSARLTPGTTPPAAATTPNAAGSVGGPQKSGGSPQVPQTKPAIQESNRNAVPPPPPPTPKPAAVSPKPTPPPPSPKPEMRRVDTPPKPPPVAAPATPPAPKPAAAPPPRPAPQAARPAPPPPPRPAPPPKPAAPAAAKKCPPNNPKC